MTFLAGLGCGLLLASLPRWVADLLVDGRYPWQPLVWTAHDRAERDARRVLVVLALALLCGFLASCERKRELDCFIACHWPEGGADYFHAKELWPGCVCEPRRAR